MKSLLLVSFAAATLSAPLVLAHGDASHASKATTTATGDATAFGRPGDATKVTRTVRIAMSDEMRFTPSTVAVKKGETIRFVIANKGKVLHEMVLGTPDELTKHAELMRKFPDMEHDDPYMAHVKPGAEGDIVWTFDRAGNFAFACLIPGHSEAGMVGKVVVK